MPELDAQDLADQAAMLGLVTRAQAREAMTDAEDGSLDAVIRSFTRKGLLTSWQIERLKKGGDLSGFFFGGCKVLFHLAEGTFARVYRGERMDSRTPVAIKVLRQRFANDAASIERFNKEAEAGMKLSHDNIVRILDYGEEDKKYYMIMEYVEGANLRDFLKIRGRLTEDHALPLMIGLVKGLKYSIEHGVTHRDIKGTNILISNSGEAKLVDFGLAGLQTDDQKSQMTSQRTVDYSALERRCGSEKGDPRSDIYFLGSVFYQMLTGQLPMKEAESKDMLQKMLKRSFGAIVPLSEHRLAPDPELSRIVEKMMQLDLKARYQKLDDVLVDLERFERRLKAGITGIEEAVSDEPDFLADFGDIFADQPSRGTGPSTASSASGGESPATQRKSLLCVETQSEVQDALRKTLNKSGYRVVLLGDPERASERFKEEPTDGVLFDVDGLGQEAINALKEMHEACEIEGKPLVALVLLGPRQSALREQIPTGPSIVVLSKPVKMKQVQLTLARLVPPQ
ncbi:MAG: protein kinase [Isosphaeraceae bacterium]